MTAKRPRLVVLATLGGVALLVSSGPVSAQALPTVPNPPAPAPSAPPPTALGAPVPEVAPPPPSAPFTPPPPGPPPEVPAAPAPAGWLLEGVLTPGIGFFFNVELTVVKPEVSANLSDTVTFPSGATSVVAVPQASLHWTVSPRIEVGQVLPDNQGLFALSYRFLTSSGSSTVTGPDGAPANLSSQVDFNVVDFDYGTPIIRFAPKWSYDWRLGFRLSQAYFASNVSDAAVAEQTTNYFLGGGLHGRFDLSRDISFIRGLATFSRIDGAVVLGQVRQRFNETVFNPDGTTSTAMAVLQRVQTIPVVTLQTGLTYTPPSWQRFHLTGGYQFEEWFGLGRISGTSSRGDLFTNVLFLRAQFDY
jgi:hypothetical protein